MSRGISGSVAGRASSGSISAVVDAPGFSANLSVTTRGNQQSFSILSQGDIRSVAITMVRKLRRCRHLQPAVRRTIMCVNKFARLFVSLTLSLILSLILATAPGSAFGRESADPAPPSPQFNESESGSILREIKAFALCPDFRPACHCHRRAAGRRRQGRRPRVSTDRPPIRPTA